jgi:hypothetical protein
MIRWSFAMKKLLLIFCGVTLIGASASANEIRNVITDSVQLTVNGSSTTTQRLASEYSVSGTNMTATTMGGLGAGTAGAAPTITDGTYTLTTAGQAFSFTESGRMGANNVATSAIDHSDGTLDTHTTYGQLTTISGGTKGSLAGTLSPTGIPTITAGGQGTTAIGQRTVTLSVFD